MVLGLSAKNRKEPTIHLHYQIHILEIKPWPPTQSLRSLRSVFIQWENGDRSSGSTKTVAPSIGSVIGEGKIEFNESFRLPVTLTREPNVKNKDVDIFQKNLLEFNLYEPRRDKTMLLATATINLAEYGVVKENAIVTAPVNSKRSFRNTAQPVLVVEIEPIEKAASRTSSSLRDNFAKQGSLDKNSGESVSALMNEEYAEESEIASFTDDDMSSHSSLAVSSSTVDSNNSTPSQKEVKGPVSDSKVSAKKEKKMQEEKSNLKPDIKSPENTKSSSHSSSTDLSSELESQVKGHASVSNSPISKLTLYGNTLLTKRTSSTNSLNSQPNGEADEKRAADVDDDLNSCVDDTWRKENGKNGLESEHEEKRHSIGNVTPPLSRGNFGNLGSDGDILNTDRLKHVKSVRSLPDTVRSNGVVSVVHQKDMKENSITGDDVITGSFRSNMRKDVAVSPKEARSAMIDGKIRRLEDKVMNLEAELREAAAIEAALYSIVAEHGSSMSKVHAPARRLSRFYLHACKESSRLRRASAARSCVSGLVLIAKACGNDVPRLTFWLSNAVVLRAIVSQANGGEELPLSASPSTIRNSSQRISSKISSPVKWKDSYRKSDDWKDSYRKSDDWKDPNAFSSALEKAEAWIFSRIIESIWWQTLTPHMQSAAAKSINGGHASAPRKNIRRTSSLSDHQDQVNFSLEHWKKAFKDACERLCPVRAEGHECGCLPLLSKLIMEQCVARLDVAMFNAILRKSADEMPTDPVSDPISDSKVLPIPAGISSFGAGAQLKNAIGNWSRWLSDLFGMDDDDPQEDNGDHDDDDERQDTSFKSFHLLNALSDLMMLPKDLLLSKSVRKEVCPTFGAPLIKRVLDNFVPDEFCPDPVPKVVLEALGSELNQDALEPEDESITNYPCIAAPPLYSPPSTASVNDIIGDIRGQPQLRRSGSSVLRKSNTSDDELDELNSPLASILMDGSRSSPVSTRPGWITKESKNQNAVRYELLRDIWMNYE